MEPIFKSIVFLPKTAIMSSEYTILDQPEETPALAIYDSIGGWLVLIAIGLVITPFTLGYGLFAELLPVFEEESWSYLTSPDSSVYHPLWKPLILFEVIGNIIFLLFVVVVNIYFFGRRRQLPLLIIIYYIGHLAFILTDNALAAQIPLIAEMDNNDSYQEIGRAILTVGIWVPYFLISKRVKGTFVH